MLRLSSSCLASGLATLLLCSSLPAAAEEPQCPRFVESSSGLPTDGEWRSHPALGDVNGDGHLDLAALPRKTRGPRVFLNDGKAGWKEASTGILLNEPPCGVGAAFADVNGDGKLDLGVANHCRGVTVFHGDGGRLWRLGANGRYLDRVAYEDLAFGDLDADGRPEMVAVGAFEGGIEVFTGDGNGGWKPARKLGKGLPERGSGHQVELADLNGDGLLDVVASYRNQLTGLPGELSPFVWMRKPDGEFQAASEGLPTDSNLGVQYWGVAVGDVNGDGHPDLAMGGSGSPDEGVLPLAAHLGDGQGHWRLATEGLPQPSPRLEFAGVELSDFDADGRLDLAAVDVWDGAIRLWMGDGTGRWAECPDTGLPAGRPLTPGWGLSSGDLNGDGKPDLAAGFGRLGAGSLEVWIQR